MKIDKYGLPILPPLGIVKNPAGGLRAFNFEIAMGVTQFPQILRLMEQMSNMLKIQNYLISQTIPKPFEYNSQHHGKKVKVDSDDFVVLVKVVVKKEPWQEGGR
jgi:hypothetical protein